MNQLTEQLHAKHAQAFTHSGKFHADDVFSAALLLYLNPEIRICRGNRVPEEFEGIIFDIGRGTYDHHQKDSRIRENGTPYAAFGLLWEVLGADILGEELALRFDEEFVQPLDRNDNTGEKNELAALIGDFNPVWDEEGNNDGAFFEAVNLAGTVLENKFAKYLGNERADQQVEAFLKESGWQDKILVMPKFVPCQKKLADTEIEFIVFPSNRGGFCVQPLKKPGSMNYKCSFPSGWPGLENEELQRVSGLATASFCHKGGFLLSAGTLEDAVAACRISQRAYVNTPVIVYYREEKSEQAATEEAVQRLLEQCSGISEMKHARVKTIAVPQMPERSADTFYFRVDLEKEEWKELHKKLLRKILKEKPEAVIVGGSTLMTYPMIHLLRKKHVPVLVAVKEGNGEQKVQLVRIPSGS